MNEHTQRLRRMTESSQSCEVGLASKSRRSLTYHSFGKEKMVFERTAETGDGKAISSRHGEALRPPRRAGSGRRLDCGLRLADCGMEVRSWASGSESPTAQREREADQVRSAHRPYLTAPTNSYGGGNAVPDLDFTNPMSALLIDPSTVTSSRKFELVTA